jgi:hypothetical protein
MTSNSRSTVQNLALHRKKLPAAWPAFESKLAEALADLEENQYLVITAKRGWAFVQFAGEGSFGLLAECVGNNYLDEAHALSAGQMALLRRIGWSSPTGTPEEASPKLQPEGSPNFFRNFARPVPFREAARMAVRALTEVFEIPHPGYLMYKAFERDHSTILFPTLGLKRERTAPPEPPRESTADGVRKLVLEAIRNGSGNRDLEGAANGELSLRFGSAAVYVRVLEKPLCIRMFSPLLDGVASGDLLLERLNEMNVETSFARFFALEGRVLLSTEMLAAPFSARNVAAACLQLGSLADEVGGTLQKEFGGRRAFEEESEGAGVQ